MSETKVYPVKWLVKALKQANGKKSSLCICGYSKRVWYMNPSDGSPMAPFLIQNIDIIEDKCADGAWCLDTQCKYNTTTPESFTKANKYSSKEEKELTAGWNNLIQMITNISEELKDKADFDETVVEEYSRALIELKK